MLTRTIATLWGTRFSDVECDALRSLRSAYEAEQHIFTAEELAHLRFLRWLVRSPRWNDPMDCTYSEDDSNCNVRMRLAWTAGYIA